MFQQCTPWSKSMQPIGSRHDAGLRAKGTDLSTVSVDELKGVVFRPDRSDAKSRSSFFEHLSRHLPTISAGMPGARCEDGRIARPSSALVW